MTYYRIVNWDEHYEVDKDSRAWTAGKPFRQAPLEYIRVPARRDWNLKTLELRDEVGDQVWFYIGIFEKLCGIVGCEPRCRREGGVIRNSEGAPADLSEIARMLRIKPETAAHVLTTLARPQTRWLEAVADEAPTPSAEAAASADSARPAAVADFGENCSKTSQVKLTQRKPEQDKALPVVLGQLVGHLVPTPEPSCLASSRREVLDSTRLGFLASLREILGATDLVECRTVSNFEQWVWENISSGRAGPDLRATALEIARGSAYGDKPVAVFMARVKRELGYVPPTRRAAGLASRKGQL